MKHVHPLPSVSVGVSRRSAEEEILLDGHVADERKDEQGDAEYHQPEGARNAHHAASLLTYPGKTLEDEAAEQRPPEPPHPRLRDTWQTATGDQASG